jgi:hypothetical protein
VLLVIFYVIVVGGILCIQDQGYNFSDYLDDSAGCSRSLSPP